LFNKMLTGSREYPVKLTNWNITFHHSAEDAKNSIPANALFDIWEFANIMLWTDKVFMIMQNLEMTGK
jgi:hypothetical protein